MSRRRSVGNSVRQVTASSSMRRTKKKRGIKPEARIKRAGEQRYDEGNKIQFTMGILIVIYTVIWSFEELSTSGATRRGIFKVVGLRGTRVEGGY